MNDATAQEMSWSTLHDLALLYLALTYGMDTLVSPEDTEMLRPALHRHQPEAAPEQVRRAIRDALLVYIGSTGEQMLEIAVTALGQALPVAQRRAVLEDMADLASADGPVLPGGMAFLQELAHRWEVEPDR